mgnify:CR=1 FL=1
MCRSVTCGFYGILYCGEDSLAGDVPNESKKGALKDVVNA